MDDKYMKSVEIQLHSYKARGVSECFDANHILWAHGGLTH